MLYNLCLLLRGVSIHKMVAVTALAATVPLRGRRTMQVLLPRVLVPQLAALMLGARNFCLPARRFLK